MATQSFLTESQSGLRFPKSLTEEYRPTAFDGPSGFVGLIKPKRILANFCAAPREGAGLLFIGAPGTGKSTMARVLASQLRAEVHVISSAECRIDALANLVRINQYVPLNGGWHVNILEEFDSVASSVASAFLLSKLDGTSPCPRTVWIMTANDISNLDEKFISRTLQIRFDGYGSGPETVALLERIWDEKAPKHAPRPSFAKLCSKNIRQALQNLELEIMSA